MNEGAPAVIRSPNVDREMPNPCPLYSAETLTFQSRPSLHTLPERISEGLDLKDAAVHPSDTFSCSERDALR